MAKPYSVDLRERVVGAVEQEGLSRRRAAARFGVSYSAAIDWVKPSRDREPGAWPDRRSQAEEDFVRASRLAGATMSEGGLHLARAGLRTGRARSEGRLPLGVGVRPRREPQLQKKTLIASERDRPDVARRRAQWTRHQNRVARSRLVFIDETWTKTNMAPLRGWARRGQRLDAKVPYRRWRTMTFLAALRHDRVEAPWLVDGPINGERFLVYVEKVLVPTLRPGDIVILDNLGSHRGKAVRRAIRSAGARLFFLPKYSPDQNPIEQFFATLKHLLRRAAERTADAVCNAIGHVLDTVTSTECTNYFAQAGYDPT